MRAFAIAAVVALTLAIPAAAADKSLADYPSSFYVRHVVNFDGCVMNVTEGNVEYGLIDSGLGRTVCFNVGQTLQGKISGNHLEVLYTDSKGKAKTAKYQIVSQKEI